MNAGLRLHRSVPVPCSRFLTACVPDELDSPLWAHRFVNTSVYRENGAPGAPIRAELPAKIYSRIETGLFEKARDQVEGVPIPAGKAEAAHADLHRDGRINYRGGLLSGCTVFNIDTNLPIYSYLNTDLHVGIVHLIEGICVSNCVAENRGVSKSKTPAVIHEHPFRGVGPGGAAGSGDHSGGRGYLLTLKNVGDDVGNRHDECRVGQLVDDELVLSRLVVLVHDV